MDLCASSELEDCTHVLSCLPLRYRDTGGKMALSLDTAAP